MGDGVPIFNAESYLRMREDDEDFAQLWDAINAPQAPTSPTPAPPPSFPASLFTPLTSSLSSPSLSGSPTTPLSTSSSSSSSSSGGGGFLSSISSPLASEAIGKSASGRKPSDVKKKDKEKEEKARREAEARERARNDPARRQQQRESANEVLTFLKHFLRSQLFAFFLEDSSHDSVFHVTHPFPRHLSINSNLASTETIHLLCIVGDMKWCWVN
jgi:hypothetical protein